MSISDHHEHTAGVESYVRLQALAMHLKAHGFAVETVAGGLIVRNMSRAGCCANQKTAGDTITCRPYQADSGRYWYFTSWQQPIAETERITDALVMIKGYLGAPD
ncbi:hypothetical protein F8568_009725 [Actinomadura sp. LD22]|uniref:Uncharacterized protein n=1 Tax=Actinomadura physcomitrii TaxID=2650748 RepID=A0A6I4MA28_9ACTN|nr:hypothetical protein [Actinomadura physcomitrii]MWA00651.1 hypothetical protein [Actinomadura physcomitrii]